MTPSDDVLCCLPYDPRVIELISGDDGHSLRTVPLPDPEDWPRSADTNKQTGDVVISSHRLTDLMTSLYVYKAAGDRNFTSPKKHVVRKGWEPRVTWISDCDVIMAVYDGFSWCIMRYDTAQKKPCGRGRQIVMISMI